MSAPHRRAGWHEAFDAQMEQWRWLRNARGRQMFYDRLDFAKPDDITEQRYEEIRDMLLELEERKLLHADPIYVTDEMCDIIEYAVDSFKPEPFLPPDLLTTGGFLLFARPIEVMVGEVGDQVKIPFGAFAWRVEELEDTDRSRTEPRLFVSCYFDWLAMYGRHADDHGHPRVLLSDFAAIKFGEEETRRFEPTELFQATLRVMAEVRFVSRYAERPDRVARRTAKKNGFEERDVLVVRLRRQRPRKPSEPQSTANYSHRFLVSGHWRNQWYPSLHLHRQKWIFPYVKGAEELPLRRPKRRVFVLHR